MNRFAATVTVTVLLVSTLVRADMISLSGAENARNIAEIAVEPDAVTVRLEVYLGDAEAFVDILPDHWFRDDAPARPDEAERWRRFAREGLQVTADGRVLPVEVLLSEPRLRVERFSPFAGLVNPYSGTVVSGPPEDKRVIYAELRYSFDEGDQPAKITIQPPLDDRGMARLNIGFTLTHRGVQVVDFKALAGRADLQLDWDDPWYSRFEQPTLRRWQQSGLMTFLYIEPYEVRHEMLVRVKDMLPLVDLDLRDPDWIEADEFRAVEARLGEFLLAHSHVVIDGVRGQGMLDRLNFVRYTRRQTSFLTEPERLSVLTAKLGVVVTYLTEGIPQEVAMTWDLFTERVQEVPANAIDPAGPFPTTVTPDDPVHVWTNFLKTFEIPTVEAVAVESGLLPPRVPVLSIVLLLGLIPAWLSIRSRAHVEGSRRGPLQLGAVLIVAAAVAWPLVAVDLPGNDGVDDAQSSALLENLLRNVYRAFDMRDEEDVYDRLAVTVSGDLLTDIYLDNRRSFEVQQAGGAQAKVEALAIESVVPERDGHGYRLDATWVASGSVGHWGHVHVRTNRYHAVVTVEPDGGAWKITGLEVLDETRIDSSAATGP